MASGIQPKLTILSSSICVLLTSFAYGAETDLGSLGETELQQAMGDSVQTVCGGFARNEDALTPQQVDLFNRCSEMVNSANELLDKGDTANSLRVSAEELANILQQVAGEEVIAQSNIVIDTTSVQNAMIGSRISIILNRLTMDNTVYPDDAEVYSANRQILGMGASGDQFGLNEEFSIFFNASGSFGDQDTTDREDGFDLDGWSYIVGADYLISDDIVLGASFGWENFEVDYDVNQRVSGGELSVDSATLSLYGLYHQKNYYVSGILGFGRSDFDTSRKVLYLSNNPNAAGANRRLTSDVDSDQTNLSLTMGYQIIGEPMTINPYIKLTYLDIDIDAFAEKDSLPGGGLGLQYQAQSIDSFMGILGVQASWVLSQDFGVLTPYLIAEWHNEFENDVEIISAQYIHDPRNNQVSFSTDKADSNYFNFSIGASLVLPYSFQLFVDASTIVAMEDFEYNSFTAGIRKAF